MISSNERLLIAALMVVLLNSFADAKGRKPDVKEGFPDYNRLEYAKPRPPVEDQVKEPTPGSIQMRVGKENSNEPREVIPSTIPLARPVRESNTSEPPFDELFENALPAAAAADPAASPAASTAAAPVASPAIPPQ